MTVYVDSSALVACYLREGASEAMLDAVEAADSIATARLTLVEVGRAISQNLPAGEAREARAMLDADWAHFEILELDRATCTLALEVAIETGARTLDALQIGAMWRLGGEDTKLLTRDVRQARAARELGFALHPASVAG